MTSSNSNPMTTHPHPRLHLASGTQFGHVSGPPWRRTPHKLVEVTQEIAVGPGLHLLVAPNGSGKTTLLRTLAGLHAPLQGRPEIAGLVHYVADELRLDPELRPRTLFQAWFNSAALSRAHELAALFRLDVDGTIGKQSRGNRQKVTLIVAETLASCSGASVLLLDEPLTGLDAGTRATVAEHWAATPAVLRLVVLHEPGSVRRADSIFTIKQGTLRHVRERKNPPAAEPCLTLCQ